MATQLRVTEVEPTNLDWLKLGRGGQSDIQYQKTDKSGDGMPVHVDWMPTASGVKAILTRDREGMPLLKGDEDQIVVNFMQPAGVPPGLPVMGGWQSAIIYEKHPRP